VRALKTTSAPHEASTAPQRPLVGGLQAVGAFFDTAIRDQALRWPLLAPLALTLGAGAYMSWPTEPGWAVLLAAILIPGAAAFLFGRLGGGGGQLSFLLILAASAALGAAAGKLRAESVAAPILLEQIGPVRIEGVIAEIDASERSRRIRLAVRAIEDLTPSQTPKFVRFSVKGDIALGPGRAVACRAILSPPPRPVVPGDYVFHRDAWFQQLGGVGFAIGACEPLANPPPQTLGDRATLWIGAMRRAISEHVFKAAGPKGGGMSAAMLAGDRSFITPDDSEALRLSGLAHLLSISGVHMVLAGGIFFFAIRFLWPLCEPLALRAPAVQVAAFGAIIACTLYFIISGGEIATQRAYIMAMIGFGAKLFDRPALSLRSLAVALTVVVLLHPEAVVTPGFQMSFAASGALIALYEAWPRLDRPSNPGLLGRVSATIIGAAATSLTASFATMPFALYHFNRAALFSVLANIATTPIITLWTTPAAAAAAITAPFHLDGPFMALLGKSLETVIAIAKYSVAISPDVPLPRLPTDGLILSAIAIAAFCIFTRAGRLIMLAPLALAATAWLSASQPVGYVATDGSVFLQADQGWLELVDWRGQNGLDPLVIGDAISKAPCPGKGAPCTLDLPSGAFTVAPPQAASRGEPPAVERMSAAESRAVPPPAIAAEPKTTACPTTAELVFQPHSGPPLHLDPCYLAQRGGAVIEIKPPGRSVRIATVQTDRPWTPTLRAPRAKPPKATQPRPSKRTPGPVPADAGERS
jgi:competence protein ComEC